MIPLVLNRSSLPLTVLCIGAHSDDLEIGCGGTILRLLATQPLSIRWVVLASPGARANEARESAGSLLAGAHQKHVETHDFRDGFFPFVGGDIKETFEKLKREVSPDIIFTHTRKDLHQDHRVVSELTWSTFRDHLIFEYEIPKYDGDLGSPNVFVSLTDAVVDTKVAHLLKFFHSQRDKRWFDEATFRGLLRLRGVESGQRYAEAFYCRKAIL